MEVVEVVDSGMAAMEMGVEVVDSVKVYDAESANIVLVVRDGVGVGVERLLVEVADEVEVELEPAEVDEYAEVGTADGDDD